MKKNLYNLFELSIFALFAFFSVILAFGKGYSDAVLQGISLWIFCVLPALFPYLFITAVLSSLKITGKLSNKLSPLMNKAFNVSGSVGYAFIMSVISGYPLGAKLISDLKQNQAISDAEAVRGAILCSTSSPMFLLSSVGGIMFNSPAFGLKLFLCHLLSAIITGLIFSRYKKAEKPSKAQTFTPKKVDNILYEGVYSSIISVLTVGGIITVFYLFTELLLSLGVLSPIMKLLSSALGSEHTASGLVFGLFECTRGLKTLANGGITLFALPVACFLTSFGGLSVLMQSIAFLKKAKIKTAPFFVSKTVSAVISFILGLIVSLIFA